jgi:hypothetical protein
MSGFDFQNDVNLHNVYLVFSSFFCNISISFEIINQKGVQHTIKVSFHIYVHCTCAKIPKEENVVSNKAIDTDCIAPCTHEEADTRWEKDSGVWVPHWTSLAPIAASCQALLLTTFSSLVTTSMMKC